MNAAAKTKSLKKRRSRETTNRPWIPPPAKTTSSFNTHLETGFKKNFENQLELDTLQDIQSKITELDIFVKSLDSVLGRIRYENETHDTKNEMLETRNESQVMKSKTDTEIVSVDEHDILKDEVVEEKLKDYKKKMKLLLKVVHISELEREKLRQLVEDRELVVIALAKDLDNWKTKLVESNAEKKETETKLEKILTKLNAIESQQLKRTSKSPDSKRNAQLDTLTAENITLKAKVSSVEKHLSHSEEEINKLKENLLIYTEKKSKKENAKENNNKSSEMDKLQITVETLGKHNESFHKALHIMEKQLEDANLYISKQHLDQNPQQWKDLTLPHCTDLKILQEELQAKSVRITLLEGTLRQKSEDVVKLNKEKTKLEYEYEVKLRDCERQLHISLTTNQSLQNYVTHLKNSYAAVFSQTVL